MEKAIQLRRKDRKLESLYQAHKRHLKTEFASLLNRIENQGESSDGNVESSLHDDDDDDEHSTTNEDNDDFDLLDSKDYEEMAGMIEKKTQGMVGTAASQFFDAIFKQSEEGAPWYVLFDCGQKNRKKIFKSFLLLVFYMILAAIVGSFAGLAAEYLHKVFQDIYNSTEVISSNATTANYDG